MKKKVVLEITLTGVKVMEMGIGARQEKSIVSYQWHSSAQEKEAMVKIENDLRIKYGRRDTEAYLLIPFAQSYLHTFTLPWIRKRNRKSAFTYLLEEEIPLPPEERITDVCVVAEDKKANYLRVLVGAAKKPEVHKYMKYCAQAGLSVAGINYSVAAVGQALKRCGLKKALYIHVEERNLNLILFDEGVPLLVRNAVLEKDDAGSGPERATLVREIRRMLVRSGLWPMTETFTVITGKDPLAASLGEELSAGDNHFSVDGEVWPRLWAALQCEERGEDELALMSYAWGIREGKSQLNFNREALKIKKKERERHWSVALALLIGAGSLAWYMPYREELKIQQEISRLQQEVQSQAVGGFTESQLFLPGSARVEVGDFLQRVPESVQLIQVEVTISGLLVKGQAESGDGVHKLIKVLEELNWRLPTLQEYSRGGDGKIKFSLAAGNKNK